MTYRLPIQVLIASYEQIRTDSRKFHGAVSFDLVVLDEAQRIKNLNSATSFACRLIPRSRSWALTGTPLENQPQDLVAIFRYLKPQLLIVLGGFGTASFHPQSVSMAGDVSGSRRGYGVSLFIVGGTAGLAASPFVVPRIVERFGLESLVWLAVPTVIAVLAMARVIPIRNEDRKITRLADVGASFRPNLWPMVNLTVVGIIRTISGVGFATFFVLLLKDRGLTLQQGGDLLFVFQGGAVIGGFVGGWLSDRLGRSRVIWTTILLSTPFLFASLYDTGPLLPVWLFLAGFMNMASNSVSVAMAQELVPDSAGTASSFPMGFSWGAAGGALIVFGGIADRVGVVATLEVLAVIPMAAVALALMLPRDREFRKAATEVRKVAAAVEEVT